MVGVKDKMDGKYYRYVSVSYVNCTVSSVNFTAIIINSPGIKIATIIDGFVTNSPPPSVHV